MNEAIHARTVQTQGSVTTSTPASAKAKANSRQVDDAIKSIFLLRSDPLGGLWKSESPFNAHHTWQLRGGTVHWKPFVPSNSRSWSERIINLDILTDQKRQSGTFLRLSRTSQAEATWSLPAIASCPVRDETCQNCYAMAGWYRIDHSLQLDRVLRLEYLRRVISECRLSMWIDWIVPKLNALRPSEPFPALPHYNTLPDSLKGGPVSYFRWHDSGDLFHVKYARAIFHVCEATPRVAHWLPTRASALIKSLVQQGVKIPSNLSILVSVQRGGVLEQDQIQVVHDVLKVQPSARIGLAYFVNGPASRKVDAHFVQETFGRNAVTCPAIVAKDKDERVCRNCRRCWAGSIESPIVYPKI